MFQLCNHFYELVDTTNRMCSVSLMLYNFKLGRLVVLIYMSGCLNCLAGSIEGHLGLCAKKLKVAFSHAWDLVPFLFF